MRRVNEQQLPCFECIFDIWWGTFFKNKSIWACLYSFFTWVTEYLSMSSPHLDTKPINQTCPYQYIMWTAAAPSFLTALLLLFSFFFLPPPWAELADIEPQGYVEADLKPWTSISYWILLATHDKLPVLRECSCSFVNALAKCIQTCIGRLCSFIQNIWASL